MDNLEAKVVVQNVAVVVTDCCCCCAECHGGSDCVGVQNMVVMMTVLFLCRTWW